MKNIKYYFIAYLLFTIYACDVSYNDDFIDSSKTYGTAMDIDPGFQNSGFNNINQISIYQSYEHKVVYQRTYGISRELDIELSIDEKALNDYNSLYETSYKLLPDEYYDLPTNIQFAEKASKINFPVTFYPEKLVNKVGLKEASNYVLPLCASPVETKGISADSTQNVTLLRVNMLEPIISVAIPSTITELEFIKDSGFDEEVRIESTLNFTGFKQSLITVSGTQDDVDDYNQANGSNYLLLPSSNYSFDDITIDNNYQQLIIDGKINANGLDESHEYLLPCYIGSSVYTILQSKPIFYKIKITNLLLTVGNAGKVTPHYTSAATTTGNITVSINSLISDDLSINFAYAPSLITTYNTENGTNYQTLPEQCTIHISEATIAGGSRSINVPFTINTSSLNLEDGVHYLVPFVLQEDDLELGSVNGSPVVYFDVTKTVLGTYSFNKISTQRERTCGNTIWKASESARKGDAIWDAAIDKAQYGFTVDMSWDKGYAMLFTITSTDMPGKADCKKIEVYTFLESTIDGGSDGEGNKITDNQSYYNTATGEIYIDFTFYESWCALEGRETYSLTR